jgi:HEAT repeat protein
VTVDIAVPETPDVPYAQREDAFAQQLLEQNGLADTGPDLRALLDADSPLVAAAAARRLGALGDREALPRLRELAHSPNDLLAVHAAAGLARLEPDEGLRALRDLTALPVEACPGAVQAGGELARLGDRGGADAVARALASANPLIRTIGAKQLLLLARAGDGDAVEQLGALLDDPVPAIPWIAEAQLNELNELDEDPRAGELLAAQRSRLSG